MPPIIRQLELQDYQITWQKMQEFTKSRDLTTPDEIWVVEHPEVFTLGLNGKQHHILKHTEIPAVQTDRGGQVTFHGPGQLVVYTLLDLERLKLNIRQLVTILEQAMIDALAQYGIHSNARKEAPGVYIEGKKIGSVGLRIKNKCSYHGLSLNNQMDLTPFTHINPCGYPGMEVTQLFDQGVKIHTHELALPVVHAIMTALEKK